MRRRMAISKGGQISIPAAVRRRWGTSTVIATDEGTRLVIEPAPDDPIAATVGIFAAEAAAGPPLDEIRAQMREDEAEAEDRRLRR